jgi:hypothetical protein
MSKLPNFVDPNGNCLTKVIFWSHCRPDRQVHGAADFVAFVNVCQFLGMCFFGKFNFNSMHARRKPLSNTLDIWSAADKNSNDDQQGFFK